MPDARGVGVTGQGILMLWFNFSVREDTTISARSLVTSRGTERK